jgi:hypothetical protein
MTLIPYCRFQERVSDKEGKKRERGRERERGGEREMEKLILFKEMNIEKRREYECESERKK